MKLIFKIEDNSFKNNLLFKRVRKKFNRVGKRIQIQQSNKKRYRSYRNNLKK